MVFEYEHDTYIYYWIDNKDELEVELNIKFYVELVEENINNDPESETEWVVDKITWQKSLYDETTNSYIAQYLADFRTRQNLYDEIYKTIKDERDLDFPEYLIH